MTDHILSMTVPAPEVFSGVKHLWRLSHASLALSSLRISNALWILMNSAAACLLPGCLSGCFSRASFRYL